MRRYKARRRFMHGLKVYKQGDIIELDSVDAGRLAFLGCVDGPIKEPRKKRVKRDKSTNQ